jgi:CheY-like chemotaxis protein
VSRHLHILLVEDDEVDVMHVRRALAGNQLAHQLHVVSTSDAAFAALGARGEADLRAVWLVLLDLNLPGSDGFAFLDRLRATPALARLPVVVMTTSADRRDIVRAFERHISGYFIKPLEPARFAATMDAIATYWSHSEMP